MNPEERYALITKNIEEVIGDDNLKAKLAAREQLKIYWGTSPTGKPHIGYLLPLIKIGHFLKAHCRVIVLFADLHAYLDSKKSTLELVKYRVQYYEEVIKKTLELLGVNITILFFRQGSQFQLTPRYTLDMYKMLSKISVNEAQRAGAEVVKQCENPMLSSLVYPILQALDEEHLDVDIEFGGTDQRKIFALSHDFLPKIGYNKRIHLMNPMIPSFSRGAEVLDAKKMSCSDPHSKIDLLDDPKDIIKKINKAYCEFGNIADNPLLTFCKYVIFPILELQGGKEFVIDRPENYGGIMNFNTYEELERQYSDRLIHPVDLKQGVREFLVKFLEPLRDYFSGTDKVELIKKSYPKGC
jgi:tyrosyl-tRNA synthetase